MWSAAVIIEANFRDDSGGEISLFFLLLPSLLFVLLLLFLSSFSCAPPSAIPFSPVFSPSPFPCPCPP